MSWFAVSSLDDPHPKSVVPPALDSGPLTCGSLLIELGSALPSHPMELFPAISDPPRPGDLILRYNGAHQLRAEVATPSGATGAMIDLTGLDLTRHLRIRVIWEDTRAAFWVSAAGPDYTIRHADMPVAPCAPAARLAAGVTMDHPPEIALVAVSDEVEPVGPMPGLAAGTLIDTPQGPVPIETLSAGATVLAEDQTGAVVSSPVVSPVKTRLPARGSFRPVRLFAPYFGLRSDITLAANQFLSLTGPDVEYLFAQERVLVAARHLVSRRTGSLPPVADTMTWHQLLLPGLESLRIGGCSIVSLRAGRLRRHQEAHENSVLAAVPRRDLPRPGVTQEQVLSEFEARTLLGQVSRASS